MEYDDLGCSPTLSLAFAFCGMGLTISKLAFCCKRWNNYDFDKKKHISLCSEEFTLSIKNNSLFSMSSMR